MTTDDDAAARELQIALAEYEALKLETVERIKQRDNFINLNIVAAALIVGFAGFEGESVAAWLALPWTTLSFGWAYLANDEKVSALGMYCRYALSPRLGPTGLGWERSMKRTTDLRRSHKAAQLAMDLSQFVFPTAVTTIVFLTRFESPPLALVAIVVIEVLLAICLGTLFVLSSEFGRQSRRLGAQHWSNLSSASTIE